MLGSASGSMLRRTGAAGAGSFVLGLTGGTMERDLVQYCKGQLRRAYLMRSSVGNSTRGTYLTSRVASFALAVALGTLLALSVVAVAPAVPGWSSYKLVLVGLAGFAYLGVLVVGNVRRALLASLILAIPLNLGFSPLGEVLPHAGGASVGVVLYPYDLPLIGLLALSVLDALSRRQPVHFSSIDVAAILLVLWTTLSIYNSSHVQASMFEILRMAKLYALSRVIASNVNTRSDTWDVLIALLVGLILQGILGFIQYATGADLGLGLYTVGTLRRVTGMFHWPVSFGTYVATMMSVGLTLYIGNEGTRSKILVGIACMVGSVAWMLTFSRGPWIALLAGVALSCFLGWRAGWIDSRGMTKLVVFGLFVVIVGALFSRSVVARIVEVQTNMSVISDRIRLNQVALNMVRAHPFLGVGINTFIDVMQRYDTTGITYQGPWPVHNVYLLVAAETGLVGLGLFLLLLFCAFRRGLQSASGDDAYMSVYAVGLLSGLSSMLVSNLAHFDLRGEEPLYAIFWLLIGLVVAINRMTNRATVQAI